MMMMIIIIMMMMIMMFYLPIGSLHPVQVTPVTCGCSFELPGFLQAATSALVYQFWTHPEMQGYWYYNQSHLLRGKWNWAPHSSPQREGG